MKDKEFGKRVLPYLKNEYFSIDSDKILFGQINEFIQKYNELPNKETLLIEIDKNKKLKENQVKECQELLNSIETIDQENKNIEWLLDTTEKFCQDKAIYYAMSESLEIMNDSNKLAKKGSIPKLLQDALAVSFDPSVGHDYLEESDKRYTYYHTEEEKVPFALAKLNEVTRGGVDKNGTLNIIIAGINVGKTLSLCSLSSDYLNMGKNVLYITLEMAEEKIAERIDANLLNITLDELVQLPKDIFDKKVAILKSKTHGKLVIKQFPTAMANTLHIEALMNELYLKKGFKPDILIVDYINILTSSRVKKGGPGGSYLFVQSIAEELRGLGVEKRIPVWTATQLTRGAFKSSDVDMDDTAESWGLPGIADFMIALITDETLQDLNQYLVKILKTRYNKKNENTRKFNLGVDYDHFRLYDVEDGGYGSSDEDTKKVEQTIKAMKQEKVDKFKALKV